MHINENKISSRLLYLLLIASAVVMGLFYLGGYNPDTVLSETPEPLYTGAVIDWAIILVIVSILCTISFAIIRFFRFIKSNPLLALKSVSGVILLGGAMIISWHIGQGNPLDIPNYTGSSNTFYWLKMTDMYLFTSYLLLALSIAAIVAFQIYRWVRR